MLTGFPHKIQNKMVSYASPISIPLLGTKIFASDKKITAVLCDFSIFLGWKVKVIWWDLTRMVEIKRMVEKGRTENGNDSFVAFLSVPPNKSWRGIKYFFMKWWWWWIWNGVTLLLFYYFSLFFSFLGSTFCEYSLSI